MKENNLLVFTLWGSWSSCSRYEFVKHSCRSAVILYNLEFLQVDLNKLQCTYFRLVKFATHVNSRFFSPRKRINLFILFETSFSVFRHEKVPESVFANFVKLNDSGYASVFC